MNTKNLSTLKIHKLTKEQYERELAAGRIDENALYLTPDEDVDLSDCVTAEQLQTKADVEHEHQMEDVVGLQEALADANAYTDSKTSNLASTSTVNTSISAHNTSTSAHSDIRDLITALTTKLNNFLDVDDTTADQLSEVLTLIENNKGTLESLTSSKVNVSDVVNNLTTNVANKPLSAAQGVAIKALIDALEDALEDHDANTTKHITSTERTNWNAAKTHADSAHAPSDAEKNQNAFSNIKVGDTTVAADTATDTVTFVGSNVTITPDATNDKVTFAVADGSTSAKGVVQLTNSTSSTSTTTAATPNSVKTAYDLANTAKTNAATAQDRADDAYTLAESKVDSLSDLGITATAAELNYVDGVTSNIQTQLDGKAASSHNQSASTITSGTLSSDRLPTVPASKGGTGETSLVNSANALINALETGDRDPVDTSCVITQGVGDYADKFYRRPISYIWNYIKSKADALYAKASHGTHVTWSTTTPKANGTAAVGSETKVARGDHIHPLQTTVSGNAGTATKLQTARTVDGVSFDGSAAITHYGTCSTAAGTAAKTVSLTGFTLATGAKVSVKFTVTNSAANPTLNVNSTGAKAIYYKNAAISAGYLKANYIYEFIYDGTNYVIVGDVDTNDTYSAAGSSLGLVKSGGDVSISSGVITVNDDSHAHVISNVDGLQTALDGKQATISGGASTIVSSNLTASRALVSDSSGKVAVSAVTSTELGYLDGVTSNIQTQLNSLSSEIGNIASLLDSINGEVV